MSNKNLESYETGTSLERFWEQEGPFLLGESGESAGEFGGGAERETSYEASEGERWPAESPAADPYDHPRPAVAPASAELTPNEIGVLFGRKPAIVSLHWLLASPDLQQATLASLLGKTGRRSIRVRGRDISLPRYLRLLSRLSRELAEQTEQELGTSTGWQSETESGEMALSGSVGRNGQNARDDVLAIQRLINAKLPSGLSPLAEDGLCGSMTILAIEQYQRRNLDMNPPSGRVNPGDATFRSLTGAVAGSVAHTPSSGPPAGGKKYTSNPNEVTTTRTTPTPQQVVDMLLTTWSELTPNGARTLTAQFMAETGGGKYCFNWNLGNVKSGPNTPHMYLRGVWEVDSPAGAQSQVVQANGLAHIATDEEVKKHGWGRPTGKAIVVFEPPHPQCRFRACSSLQDGAQRWLGHHQAIAKRDPNFITALNAGDVAAVAHALKQARYYTAGEADYARAMTRAKAQVDQALGPQASETEGEWEGAFPASEAVNLADRWSQERPKDEAFG
jgi:hypothetical protein